MNSNGKFWEIGLKILAAAVVGIAVFVGIDKSTSRKPNSNNGPQPSPENNQQNQSWEPPREKQTEEIKQESNNKPVGEKVVNGLRGMYGTFGKLSQVISSLVDVVGSVGRLFGNNDDYGYPPRQPYYNMNNPWSCGCTISPGLNRVNDYIIQVGPMPGQQYGNNYNNGYC